MIQAPIKNLSASVRQRLLNLADKRREPFQHVLVQYGLERLLYRISRSEHRDRFVLKGALLFSIWSDTPHRPTVDIDLMSAASAETAELAAAHSHLVISRTAIHSLDVAQVDGEINQGLPIAAKVLQEGKDKLAEIQSRRKGVALFCLLVLGIVLSLYLYIRQENRTRQSNQS